jgi:protein-disulfide isomerase
LRLDWKAIAGGCGAAAVGAGIAIVAVHSVDKGGPDVAATGAIVRSYILDHPEIVPEAMERLQNKQTASAVAAHRAAIETPFGGAVQGNPKGDVTLVEYFDYACGYCRASVADVDKLVATDPNLRVVYKELPILSDWSAHAAQMSLVAAQAGKFVDFHRALYGAGSPSDAKVAEVARQFGLDPAKADSEAITREIETNVETARALRLSGTPSFVVGGDILSGAVGYQSLKDAVDKARGSKT